MAPFPREQWVVALVASDSQRVSGAGKITSFPRVLTSVAIARSLRGDSYRLLGVPRSASSPRAPLELRSGATLDTDLGDARRYGEVCPIFMRIAAAPRHGRFLGKQLSCSALMAAISFSIRGRNCLVAWGQVMAMRRSCLQRYSNAQRPVHCSSGLYVMSLQASDSYMLQFRSIHHRSYVLAYRLAYWGCRRHTNLTCPLLAGAAI
jgi:hypothetical protein